MDDELMLEIEEVSLKLKRLMLKLTPREKKNVRNNLTLVKYCEPGWADTDEENESRGWRLWCNTHDKPATHLAPNGDDGVCKKYADSEGCKCCEENRLY